MLAGLINDGNHVVVENQVLGRTVRALRDQARPSSTEIRPFTIRSHHGLVGRKSFESRLSFLELLDQFFPASVRNSEFAEFFFGEEYEPEAFPVSCSDRRNDFGGGFFCRDRLPAIDRSVFVLVKSPAGSGGPKPAVLVRLFVKVRVNVPVHFHAVVVVAPLVQSVVRIGVDEPTKQSTSLILNDPTALSNLFRTHDFACFTLFGRRAIKVDA